MQTVVSFVAPTLKTAGFRKKRHSFNRVTDTDVVQVLSFQMGSFRLDPSATTQDGGNFYGKFTINIGVYLERLASRLGMSREGNWIHEYDCHCRKRIGGLLPDGGDTWWSLQNPDLAADTALAATTDYGLPWLDELSTEQEILERFARDGRVSLGMTPAAPLHIALIHLDAGRAAIAEQMIGVYLRSDLRPMHRSYVEELLAQHGLGHLLSG